MLTAFARIMPAAEAEQDTLTYCHQLTLCSADQRLLCSTSLQAFKRLSNNAEDAAGIQLQDSALEKQEFHCAKCALYLYYR